MLAWGKAKNVFTALSRGGYGANSDWASKAEHPKQRLWN